MHTVLWTFKVPAGTSKAQLVETINATAHTYEGIPGLIRKYYGIAPDGALRRAGARRPQVAQTHAGTRA